MKILEVKNLKKSFKVGKNKIDVLKNISFIIEEGEFASILGPSGSGKSTLLNVISGIEGFDDGEVFLFDESLKNKKYKDLVNLRKEKIGFIFQFYNLIPQLTVIENLVLSSSIIGKLDYNRAKELLKKFKLEDFCNYFPEQLSGGMQQKVAIARCLMNKPKIIFADEPVGNLDHKSGIEVMEVLKELNNDKITILMVTHNEELIKYSNREIKIIDGTIEYDKKIT